MWFLKKPAAATIDAFLKRVRNLPYSYDEVGISANNVDNEVPNRFTFDHQRGLLGEGESTYRKACEALASWRMFPSSWTEIYPDRSAEPEASREDPREGPRKGDVVALVIRTFGLWWLSSCRIVHTINETGPVRRFGFAYGTLPAHVEMGEERFMVEWDENDQVWYDLRAWSRPRHPITWLGYPVARFMQARFRRDSLRAMREAVR